MIYIVRGSDLWRHPQLARSMFSDRARQFKGRLGWDVSVDSFGYELDKYDGKNPLYIVATDEVGRHTGSMRLLPMTRKTMIEEHFFEVVELEKYIREDIWECTRFCLAPDAPPQVSRKILAVAARLMTEHSVKNFLAVFDERVRRVYLRSKICPIVLGTKEYSFGQVSVGLWYFCPATLNSLCFESKINPVELELAIANVRDPFSELRS